MAGSDSRRFCFGRTMEKHILSIFVDESGILNEPDLHSRFYILTFVCHDQAFPINAAAKGLDVDLTAFGIVNLCFHAGPVIHANDQFEFMSWDLRRRIFSRMMGFARRIRFAYHCIVIDKKYINTSEQIVARLQGEMSSFLESKLEIMGKFDAIKVYYDCGQKQITNLLHKSLSDGMPVPVEFAQAVEPRKYRMFQVADLICTLKLLETKLVLGLPFSRSESCFFGGPRMFKRNILKYIKRKEI